MKHVLFGILFFLTGSISFGQTTNTASCPSSKNLKSGVASGKIEVTLPNQLSPEDVASFAKYYEPFFFVDFNSKNHVATFQMVTNTPESRRVILRFLSANQIQSVLVDGKSYQLQDFYQNFLEK
ncbi:MAG: hypothetical protein WCH03_03205 [Flavobacteriia bacterium]|jgi:hypothetical protein